MWEYCGAKTSERAFCAPYIHQPTPIYAATYLPCPNPNPNDGDADD